MNVVIFAFLIQAFSPTAKKIMRGVLVCVDTSILSPDVDILWAITNFHGAKLTKVDITSPYQQR